MSEVKYEEYPKTVKESKWMKFLYRELIPVEKNILHNVILEKSFNNKLRNLYTHCAPHNLYVPLLTELEGNCIFECMEYYNYGDKDDIRKGIAFIMYQFRDFKNFFLGREDTLKEIFDLTNLEDMYVYGDETEKLYKYNYDIMCKDLTNDQSWSNLPAQLLLLVLSRIYKIKFRILSDRFTNITYLSAFDNLPEEERPELQTVDLGHIFENHYVPLDTFEEGYEVNPLFYMEAKKVFHGWGTAMAKMRYEYLLEQNEEVID